GGQGRVAARRFRSQPQAHASRIAPGRRALAAHSPECLTGRAPAVPWAAGPEGAPQVAGTAVRVPPPGARCIAPEADRRAEDRLGVGRNIDTPDRQLGPPPRRITTERSEHAW